MKISKDGSKTTLTLESERERALLRFVLERATYTDTPPAEQEAILAFATKALDALTATAKS